MSTPCSWSGPTPTGRTTRQSTTQCPAPHRRAASETVFCSKTASKTPDSGRRMSSAETRSTSSFGYSPNSQGLSHPELRRPRDRRRPFTFVKALFADTHERLPRGSAQPVLSPVLSLSFGLLCVHRPSNSTPSGGCVGLCPVDAVVHDEVKMHLERVHPVIRPKPLVRLAERTYQLPHGRNDGLTRTAGENGFNGQRSSPGGIRLFRLNCGRKRSASHLPFRLAEPARVLAGHEDPDSAAVAPNPFEAAEARQSGRPSATRTPAIAMNRVIPSYPSAGRSQNDHAMERVRKSADRHSR